MISGDAARHIVPKSGCRHAAVATLATLRTQAATET
jgi:hypothetical protein